MVATLMGNPPMFLEPPDRDALNQERRHVRPLRLCCVDVEAARNGATAPHPTCRMLAIALRKRDKAVAASFTICCRY